MFRSFGHPDPRLPSAASQFLEVHPQIAPPAPELGRAQAGFREVDGPVIESSQYSGSYHHTPSTWNQADEGTMHVEVLRGRQLPREQKLQRAAHLEEVRVRNGSSGTFSKAGWLTE